MMLTTAEQVLTELRRVIRATQINAKTLAAHSQLTVSQLMILQLLSANGEMSPRQLSQQVNLTQATITALLDRLEERSLISRRRSNQDKRRVHVTLTNEGTNQLARAPQTLHNRFISQFNVLQSWEQTQILSTMQRIAQLLDVASIDASPILDVGSLDRTASRATPETENS
ncbi:MAG: MarR family winged helix-turn-helix transcriptional regulator [Steroidobacteraceae bacterium]